MHSGELFPVVSVALYRTSVNPSLKSEPRAGPLVCDTVADPELSVAVGSVQFTTADCLFLLVYAYMVVGQFERMGDSLSVMSILDISMRKLS